MNPKTFAALASAILLIVGTWARASIIPPGGSTTFLDTFTDTPLLLASLSTPVVPVSNVWSGTVISAVYRDAGGTLEFDYQFANNANSTDAISRMTMNPFTGFVTDVGYRPTRPGPTFPVDGTVLPSSGDRNATGDTVGFDFSFLGFAPILPGLTSKVLVIRTNATNFGPGFVSMIDGGGTTVDSFAPRGVPSPASIWAALVLIGGLAGWRLFARQALRP